MDNLIERTIAWRKQHKIDNMWSQASKVTEEWGETVSEMNHNRFGSAFEDGIGDVLVSLTIYADICGMDIKECWAKALREIERRKGKTIDGNFVKDEDERVNYQSF